MNDAIPSLTLASHRPEDTAKWAEALSNVVHASRMVCLWGDVGAGKTFFARSLIQTLQARNGVPEDVPSPTFTLVQTYWAGDLEIWHADLYRLGGVDEVFELGLIDAFETAFCMVEWPDRLGNLVPHDALHMTFSHATGLEDRNCEITCTDDTFLKACAKELAGCAHV